MDSDDQPASITYTDEERTEARSLLLELGCELGLIESLADGLGGFDGAWDAWYAWLDTLPGSSRGDPDLARAALAVLVAMAEEDRLGDRVDPRVLARQVGEAWGWYRAVRDSAGVLSRIQRALAESGQDVYAVPAGGRSGVAGRPAWHLIGLPGNLERLAEALDGRGEAKAADLKQELGEYPSKLLNEGARPAEWQAWIRHWIARSGTDLWRLRLKDEERPEGECSTEVE